MRTVLSAAAVAVALALTACGAPAAEESATPEPAAPTSADAAAKDSFPVEVKHALGTTTIDRVAELLTEHGYPDAVPRPDGWTHPDTEDAL